MTSRSADLTREWEPITPRHEEALETFRDSYDMLLDGNSPDPLAIVGAYRSGKTQLMYQMFREAWGRDIGAIYVSNPGDLLKEYREAESGDIASWLEDRIHEEVERYISGDPDQVVWFPNAATEQKEAWLDAYVNVDNAEDVEKYALFIDEVEQHYEEFLETIETDDSNPLRIINDEVADTLKVWSFGMLSAYEFIGEADWGRLNEIRIPPLNVSEVQDRLRERDDKLESFANILWWMGRGRTGLIIKFIDEMPGDVTTNAGRWVEQMADIKAQSTQVVDPVWTDLPAEQWESACRTLAFQKNGLESWLLTANEAHTADEMTSIVSNIIFDVKEFPVDDDGKTAKRIIRRNVERVFDGLCRPDENLFPHRELMFDHGEIESLLSLIEDQILSFEATGPARNFAAEALDIEPSEFSSGFYDADPTTEEIEAEVQITKPSIIDQAFQPIALNPDLLCERPTRELREEMDEALRFDIDHHLDVNIYYCPTETALENQLERVRRARNLTQPAVFIVPTEMGDAVPSDYDVFQRLRLIEVATHESSMLWDFILNLWGALENRGVHREQGVDDSVRRTLMEEVDSRDIRNTIETLYDQVNRFSQEVARTAANSYIDRYSRATTTELLWEEDRLQRDNPFWSTGELSELPVSLSYLLVFSKEPEFGQPYGKIPSAIETALDKGLISGGSSFPYGEYLDRLYGSSGYTQRIPEERKHYSDNGRLEPAVENTRTALYELAIDFDKGVVLEELNDLELEARSGDIQLLNVNVARHAYAFLRAALMSKYALSDDSGLNLSTRLELLADDLEDTKDGVEGAIERIEAADETLSAPDCAEVGSWIELAPGLYGTYRENLKTIINGVEDLAEQVEIDSEIAPLAYAYWMQLRQFQSRMSEEFDKQETVLSEMDVTTIQDLKGIYTDLYQAVNDSEAIEEYFDSREEVLARIEEIGEDIFDYASGRHRIELPGGIETVNKLNENAEKRREEIEELRTLFDRLESRHDTIQAREAEIKAELQELLTTALKDSEVEA